MASRRNAAVAVVKDLEDDAQPETVEETPEEPIAPYNLEALSDRTRPIIHMWGQVTQNRINELRLNGAVEWARMLEDMYNIVGMSVGE